MHDARMQSIADLRARIKAIEAGSDTNGRSGTHPRQCEGNPLCPDKLECREDAISEIQQKSVSWPAGCPMVGGSENDGRLIERSKQSDADRDQADSAFAKIQRLLCIREHASALLHKRLLSSGYDDRIASEAVQRAINCGLVSDERYADVLVRSRLSQGKGLRGIAFELEQADKVFKQALPFLNSRGEVGFWHDANHHQPQQQAQTAPQDDRHLQVYVSQQCAQHHAQNAADLPI